MFKRMKTFVTNLISRLSNLLKRKRKSSNPKSTIVALSRSEKTDVEASYGNKINESRCLAIKDLCDMIHKKWAGPQIEVAFAISTFYGFFTSNEWWIVEDEDLLDEIFDTVYRICEVTPVYDVQTKEAAIKESLVYLRERVNQSLRRKKD